MSRFFPIDKFTPEALSHLNAWLFQDSSSLEYLQRHGTLLSAACIDGRLDMVNLILPRTDLIRLRDHQEKMPIHYAAEFGHIEILRQLVASLPSEDRISYIDAIVCGLRTPLLYAVINGHIDIIDQLMEWGSKSFQPRLIHRSANPIHLAIRSCQLTTLQRLIEWAYQLYPEPGAAVNFIDDLGLDGSFAMNQVAHSGSIDAIEILLRAGNYVVRRHGRC